MKNQDQNQVKIKFKPNELKKMLENYGVKNIRDNGKEIVCCCPFHRDSKPSFAMNSETGEFICFSGSCGVKGDYFKFIALIEKISYEEAKKKTQHDFGDRYFKNIIDDSLYLVNNLFIEKKDPPEVSDNLEIIPLERFKNYQSVLNSINISEELALKNNFGICLDKNYYGRLAIPIIDGKTIYYELRDLTKKSPKKCLYTKGAKINNTIYCKFADEANKKYCFLTEGTKDCLSVVNFGFNSVSCFGIQISSKQISNMIKNGIEKVFILYDNDEAGKTAAKKNYKIIKKYLDCKIMKYPDNFPYKDPNEIRDRNEFMKIMEVNFR